MDYQILNEMMGFFVHTHSQGSSFRGVTAKWSPQDSNK